MDLSLLTILGGTAGIGALVAGWQTFKSWLISLQGLFLIRVALSFSTEKQLLEYLSKHAKLLRIFSPTKIYDVMDYVGRCKSEQQFAYRLPNLEYPMWWIYKKHLFQIYKSTLIADRWFPLTPLFTKIYEHVNNHNYKTKIVSRHYIRSLHGELTKNMEAKVSSDHPPDAPLSQTEENNYSLAETVCTQFPIHDVGRKDRPIPPLLYIHTPNTNKIFSDIQHWLNSKTWYLEHGIPWRRGYLLIGQPGTGKTAFVRSTAEQLGLPILAIHLATMSDHDLDGVWESLRISSPCIALLEDLDSIFNGRTFTPTRGSMQHALSFEGLINKIDGVDHCNGICLFVTANDANKIDPALKDRPGRIDLTVSFENATQEQKETLANRIFNGTPKELWKPLLTKENTMAQFQEICCQKALELYWNNTNQTNL